MLTRVDPPLDGPVILFQDVIEILHRSMLAVLLQNTLVFELHNRRRVSGILVGVDDPRRWMVRSAQRFGEEALSRCCIAFSREKEVDRRTAGVHRPVQVHPLALSPDVGLVHPPRVVRRLEVPAQAPLHFRSIPLDPSPHRDVVGAQAPIGEQLLDVAIREREAQISTDRQENHLRFKLAPFEQTGD